MGIMADLRRAFAPLPVPLDDHWRIRQTRIAEQREVIHARTIPDMDMGSSTINDMLLRIQGVKVRPWQAASIKEALGTPAIFRAVSLIANTTGSLEFEAFRNGAKMADADAPKVIKRPDPFRTSRAFKRDSAYHLATRGESWWWIAKRDGDGNALSLIVMPPWEVTVQSNPRDRLRPVIRWLDTELPREDVRLITFMPDESSPSGPFQRGVGPLQLCGAAVSVAVEAQEWAANFYAEGGLPSTIVKTHGDLSEMTEEDMAALKAQFNESSSNTTKFIDDGIESVEPFNVSVASAQMLEARQHETGNAARMFGIPGSLLEYQQAGSSLTYQNLEGEFTKFVRASLAPNYLEPIEQEMSDLLPRSTVARFNVKGFLRADAKTRAEVYNLLVPLGVMSVEQAQQEEGFAPGDVEFAPVPFAPPQAVPDRLPIQLRTAEVRCDGTRLLRGLLRPCGKLLAERGPFIGTCPRCGKEHTAAA